MLAPAGPAVGFVPDRRAMTGTISSPLGPSSLAEEMRKTSNGEPLDICSAQAITCVTPPASSILQSEACQDPDPSTDQCRTRYVGWSIVTTASSFELDSWIRIVMASDFGWVGAGATSETDPCRYCCTAVRVISTGSSAPTRLIPLQLTQVLGLLT